MVCANFLRVSAEKLDERQFRQLDYKAEKYWRYHEEAG